MVWGITVEQNCVGVEPQIRAKVARAKCRDDKWGISRSGDDDEPAGKPSGQDRVCGIAGISRYKLSR
jgi:hypothetical protein